RSALDSGIILPTTGPSLYFSLIPGSGRLPGSIWGFTFRHPGTLQSRCRNLLGSEEFPPLGSDRVHGGGSSRLSGPHLSAAPALSWERTPNRCCSPYRKT